MIKIIILLFISAVTAAAQNYFPLDSSNSYQYIDSTYSRSHGGSSGESVSLYKSILSVDSLSISMYKFSAGPLSGRHFIYDQANQKIYVRFSGNSTSTEWRLAADLNAPAGTYYISYIAGEPLNFLSDGISLQTIFNDTLLSYTMSYTSDPTKKRIYTFTENIGLTYHYSTSFDGFGYGSISRHRLVSAILDTLILNPIYLHLDTLHNIQDRPVNTIPFGISGAYTATYPALVDSFYLKLTHHRNGVDLRTFHYVFNSNLNIIVNLIFQQPGDKLLLKAYVRDKSIFNNTDTFPDTGYAVINLLPSTLGTEDEVSPADFSLSQNYPNPFNPLTTIRWQIPEAADVSIKIYDLLGRELFVLLEEYRNAGSYLSEFDASALISGVYFYTLTAGNFRETKKMTLLR